MKVKVIDCDPLSFQNQFKEWKKSANKKIENGRIKIKSIQAVGSFHYILYQKNIIVHVKINKLIR